MTVIKNGEQIIITVKPYEKENVTTALEKLLKYREVSNPVLGMVRVILQGLGK